MLPAGAVKGLIEIVVITRNCQRRIIKSIGDNKKENAISIWNHYQFCISKSVDKFMLFLYKCLVLTLYF